MLVKFVHLPHSNYCRIKAHPFIWRARDPSVCRWLPLFWFSDTSCGNYPFHSFRHHLPWNCLTTLPPLSQRLISHINLPEFDRRSVVMWIQKPSFQSFELYACTVAIRVHVIFNKNFPVGYYNNALLGDKTNYNTANKFPQFAYVAGVTWANCLLMHSIDCKKPESHLVNASYYWHSSFVL